MVEVPADWAREVVDDLIALLPGATDEHVFDLWYAVASKPGDFQDAGTQFEAGRLRAALDGEVRLRSLGVAPGNQDERSE